MAEDLGTQINELAPAFKPRGPYRKRGCHMKHNITAAVILSVGLIAAAFLYSGRYYVLVAGSDVAVRVDRWTGETKMICTSAGWNACDDAAFIKPNSK